MKVVLAVVLSCVAYGQTGAVAGPSTGYVFDSTVKALRQIRGIPGAATMSDPIALTSESASVQVSPRGDAAIAVGADGAVHVYRLDGGMATERTVSGLMTAPASVVFSPSGMAAAMYRAGSVQVLRGLPDAPEIAGSVSLPLGPGVTMAAAAHHTPDTIATPQTSRDRKGAVPSLAISDDASWLIFAHDSSVELLDLSGATRTLAPMRGAAQIAFGPRNHDVALVTGGTLTVYQDVAGASTNREYPNASAPAGLAFSADGSKVVLAGPKAVTILDRTTGDRKPLTCSCRITSLSGMGEAFRLNAAGDGPLWLLVDPSADARVVFVPARPSL
jgi:hypothetical protein